MAKTTKKCGKKPRAKKSPCKKKCKGAVGSKKGGKGGEEECGRRGKGANDTGIPCQTDKTAQAQEEQDKS